MSFIQAVTDVIANPKQVRLSQERASARALSGLESKMKAIRDTSPECMQGVTGLATHHTASTFSSRAPSQLSSQQPSRASSRDRSMPTRPAARPRMQLQRSQSELPFKSPILSPKRDFTPDITAMDLTTDQIRKNYSCDDLLKWDVSKDPLPPMSTMRGFGRYRRAECADPEWYIQNVKKQVKGIEHLPGMTAGLDMEMMTGLSNEEWRMLTSGGARRGSAVSSISATTDSSVGLLESGTRVARGFSPSGSSTKSSQTGHAYSRKGSTLSTMNLPIETDSPPFPSSLKRISTMLGERQASGPLSTIAELQTNVNRAAETHRKIERPCDFSVSGDPDSAVASDAEDEDEDGWTDVTETNLVKVSAITQMLKERKQHELHPQPHLQTALAQARTSFSDRRRGRGTTTTLDRCKTIRATRPELKRGQSKTQGTHERGKSQSIHIAGNTEEDNPELKEKNSTHLDHNIANPMNAQTEAQTRKSICIDESVKVGGIPDDGQKTGTQRRHASKRVMTTFFNPDLNIRRGDQQAQPIHVAR